MTDRPNRRRSVASAAVERAVEDVFRDIADREVIDRAARDGFLAATPVGAMA